MLRCRSCGKSYNVKDYLAGADQDLEEQLAYVRSDRV
jgi:hypothetical protein